MLSLSAATTRLAMQLVMNASPRLAGAEALPAATAQNRNLRSPLVQPKRESCSSKLDRGPPSHILVSRLLLRAQSSLLMFQKKRARLETGLLGVLSQRGGYRG